MSDYKAKCFGGAVELTLTGAPVGMGYCHCESCRHWSAGPVNGFTLWKRDTVKVTKGESNLGTFHKKDTSHRKWCKTCGGHVFTDHPLWGVVDVYAAVIEGFEFKPGVHVNYGETVLHIKDGLP